MRLREGEEPEHVQGGQELQRKRLGNEQGQTPAKPAELAPELGGRATRPTVPSLPTPPPTVSLDRNLCTFPNPPPFVGGRGHPAAQEPQGHPGFLCSPHAQHSTKSASPLEAVPNDPIFWPQAPHSVRGVNTDPLAITQAGCLVHTLSPTPAWPDPPRPWSLLADYGRRAHIWFLGFFPVLVSWRCGFSCAPSASDWARPLAGFRHQPSPVRRLGADASQISLDPAATSMASAPVLLSFAPTGQLATLHNLVPSVPRAVSQRACSNHIELIKSLHWPSRPHLVITSQKIHLNDSRKTEKENNS